MIKIRRGLDLPLSGAPQQSIEDAAAVSQVAVIGADFVGSRAAGVVDGLATVATGKKNCVVYVWYDNEFGYSCQVIRMLQHVTNTALPAFPIEE